MISFQNYLIQSINGTNLIEIRSQSNNDIIVNSDIIKIYQYEQKKICSYFKKNQTLFDCITFRTFRTFRYNYREKITGSPLIDRILILLRHVMRSLKKEFSEDHIYYVSPLRAHPKRYYMLDQSKTTISLDTLDGDAIAEVLKDNTDIKKSVNEWFAKFGLKIDVRELREVIHHLKVSQNGLLLDITDVGFGISQVLPIIIQGFLSQDNSITIIEQPEIHLHPRMQAELGDLFIKIVEENNKQLVIETHSEYLLKRIRRRISEGVISPTDVSICLFHPKTKEKDSWVELLKIGEKGNFEWPEDFYGGELLNDTIVFLKNQE